MKKFRIYIISLAREKLPNIKTHQELEQISRDGQTLPFQKAFVLSQSKEGFSEISSGKFWKINLSQMHFRAVFTLNLVVSELEL